MDFGSDILSDPPTSFDTPPPKRRKLAAVAITPPRYSDLLAAFGARRVPSSISRMLKETEGVRALRPESKTTGFSYAETDTSDMITPKSSPNGSSFGEPSDTGGTSLDLAGCDSDESEDKQEDGTASDDDVIAGEHRGTQN